METARPLVPLKLCEPLCPLGPLGTPVTLGSLKPREPVELREVLGTQEPVESLELLVTAELWAALMLLEPLIPLAIIGPLLEVWAGRLELET